MTSIIMLFYNFHRHSWRHDCTCDVQLQSAVTVSQASTWKRQWQKVETGKQWVITYGGAHSCTAKMAVLNQPAAALLARVDWQSACWNIFNSGGSRISWRGVHKVGPACAPAKIFENHAHFRKNTPFYVVEQYPKCWARCLSEVYSSCMQFGSSIHR